MDLANRLSTRLDEKKRTVQQEDSGAQETPQEREPFAAREDGTFSGEFPTGAVTERELETDEV